MSEIKWIKLTVGMFDDEKIKLIESMPDKDTILIIWIKLLAQAGKCNASGHLILSDTIPYSDEMLATIFNRPLNTVRLALETFRKFGMIEMNGDTIYISNWEKHQNIEGMEKIREQTRLRKQKQRLNEKQNNLLLSANNQSGSKIIDKCCYCGKKEEISIDHIIPISKGGLNINENCVPSCLKCNMSKTNRDIDVFLNEKLNYYKDLDLNRVLLNNKIMNLVIYENGIFKMSRDVTAKKCDKSQYVQESYATDKDLDKDLDKEKEKDLKEDICNLPNEKIENKTNVAEKQPPTPFQDILDNFHRICKSFSKVITLTEARRKTLRNWYQNSGIDEIIKVFEIAENSDFLKGKNNRNWKANFDWICNVTNRTKILEGNYLNDKPVSNNSLNNNQKTSVMNKLKQKYIEAKAREDGKI